MVRAELLAVKYGFSSVSAFCRELVQIGLFKESRSYGGFVPVADWGVQKPILYRWNGRAWKLSFKEEALSIIDSKLKVQI